MGFDLFPTNRKVEGFSVNITGWGIVGGALVEYCSDIITLEQRNGIEFNDGTKFSKEQSLLISNRLKDNSDELVQEFVDFAKKSGGFEVW